MPGTHGGRLRAMVMVRAAPAGTRVSGPATDAAAVPALPALFDGLPHAFLRPGRTPR